MPTTPKRSLPRSDGQGPDMARVVVDLGAAQRRKLPQVSVKTGKPADGYVTAGPKDCPVFLPLTQSEFDRVQQCRHQQRWAIYGGVGCLLFGAALARFPLMLPLALVIAVLSVALWFVAGAAAKGYLPRIEVDQTAGLLRLGRVHKGFVAAVSNVDP